MVTTERCTSTHWRPATQVGSAVAEEDMISAFREHGPIAGWKFLRRSNCAFIDFETGAGAAAAREALHGATFSG